MEFLGVGESFGRKGRKWKKRKGEGISRKGMGNERVEEGNVGSREGEVGGEDGAREVGDREKKQISLLEVV